MKTIFFITISLSVFALTACNQGSSSSPSAKSVQSQKAKEAADSISFSENAEIENIKNRLNLTSNPGLTGFVLLMNEAGQPIMYTGVKGKITSGSKRLTRPQELVGGDRGEYNGSFVVDSSSDEGTYGSSSPYIFFWTTNGQYMQRNGKYLYSDKPFRLSVEPLVLEMN